MTQAYESTTKALTRLWLSRALVRAALWTRYIGQNAVASDRIFPSNLVIHPSERAGTVRWRVTRVAEVVGMSTTAGRGLS